MSGGCGRGRDDHAARARCPAAAGLHPGACRPVAAGRERVPSTPAAPARHLRLHVRPSAGRDRRTDPSATRAGGQVAGPKVAVGVEATRSRRASSEVTRPDGAQPHRGSARVPRGRLDPRRRLRPGDLPARDRPHAHRTPSSDATDEASGVQDVARIELSLDALHDAPGRARIVPDRDLRFHGERRPLERGVTAAAHAPSRATRSARRRSPRAPSARRRRRPPRARRRRRREPPTRW